MVEDAVVPWSIWALLHGWFTPTVLFLLLNLVIGTIALTSKALRPHPADADDRRPTLARAPSIILDCLRSIDLHRHLPSVAAPLQTAAPKTETVDALDDGGGHLGRSQSDSGEAPAERLAGRMKKSASDKSAFAHFEAAEVAQRRRGVGEEEGEAGEVDARADDFINRFRHQLKLQRLDSLMRYKEMLTRGK